MAFSGATKILKPGGESLDKFEESVSQVSTRVISTYKTLLDEVGLWQKMSLAPRVEQMLISNVNIA